MARLPTPDYELAGAIAASLMAQFHCDLFTSELLKPEEWQRHPDMRSVALWLARQGRNTATELEVMRLVAEHVLIEWHYLPQRSAAKHRSTYAKVERLALQLKKAVEATGAAHDLMASVNGLQRARLIAVIAALAPSAEPAVGATNLVVEDVLDWLSAEASLISGRPVVHRKPNAEGARRAFFIRRAEKFLRLRYGRIPHGVVAAVTSATLNMPTTDQVVTENLTSCQ